MSKKLSLNMKYLENFTFVEVMGTFELNKAQSFINGVIKNSIENGSNKILIDSRNVMGINETIDRYKMAEFLSKITPINVKIAFLVSEIQILPDKFFENVAKNRMLNAFVTTKFKDAENWLLGYF
jgi:hypothetical protein